MELVLFILLTLTGSLYGLKNDTESKNYGPCYRECDGIPMICEYEFNVTQETTMNIYCSNCPFSPDDCTNEGCIPAGGDVRTVTVVNHAIPGPPILVCEDDRIIVKVRNLLRTETVSIHWHGIHQIGSFFMDGLPQISQHPILPGDMFIYNFTAHPAGSHMWHGHSSFQEADGLYGALIVRRAEPESVHSLYDFDLPEHIITVWHWYDRPTGEILVSTLHRNGSVNGYGLLINGKAGIKKFSKNDKQITTPLEVFRIKSGYRYRFRLIHNSAIYCPLQMSIDEHNLKVISSETSYFEPVIVDSIMVGAGDRFDFVLEANNSKMCYIMRFRGIGDCLKNKTRVHEKAYLCYDDSSPSLVSATYEEADRNGTVLNPNELATFQYSGKKLIYLTDLYSSQNDTMNYSGEPNVTLYVQIHSRNFENARFPGAWHQFNNISFFYPGPSFLKNKFHSPELCTNETSADYCHNDFCKCTYIHRIPKHSLVEIIFIDITQDRNQDHPIHLHGYKFYIVATEVLGRNASLERVKEKNEKGLIQKNLLNPISKDTFSVPNKGYSIVRFIADNPGFWLLHCHVTNHMELGMAMLLQIGSPEEIMEMCHTYQQCGEWYKSNGTKLKMPEISYVIYFCLLIYLCVLRFS